MQDFHVQIIEKGTNIISLLENNYGDFLQESTFAYSEVICVTKELFLLLPCYRKKKKNIYHTKNGDK